MAKEYQVGDTTYEFPDEYDDAKVKLILKGKGLLNAPGSSAPDVGKLPESSVAGGNFIMQLLGGALPAAGSFFGPEGTVAGTLAQKALPPEFGGVQQGEGFSDVAKDTGINLAVNNAGPAVLSKLVTKIPGVAHILETNRLSESAKNLSDKFLKNPELSTLPESGYPTGAVRGAGGKFQENPSGFAKNINEGIRTSQQQVNDLIYKGFSPTKGTIDAPAILDELAKNGSKYSEIDPIVKNDLKEFLTAVDKQKPLASGESPYLKYDKKRILYSLGTGAVTGAMFGHEVAGAAGMGALLLTHDVLSRVMQNPTATHALIMATKKGASEAKPLLDKIILGAMAGGNAIYRAADGTEQTVHIGDGGQLVPTRE